MVARPVRWGIPDSIIALLLAQVASAIGGFALLVALGYVENGTIDLGAVPWSVLLLLQAFLWAGYGGYTVIAARVKGNGVVADFGWKFRVPDLWQGLLVGFGAQIIAVPIIYVIVFYFTGELDVSEAARELTDRATTPLDIVILVVIVAVGAPIIEELFFRGLLLRSIQRRFGNAPALIGSSLIFAVVHFQIVQFPALLMFGFLAGWLTLRSGRLGPAIWAHVGFNAVTVVALLAVS